jgi:hypothetical protein
MNAVVPESLKESIAEDLRVALLVASQVLDPPLGEGG